MAAENSHMTHKMMHRTLTCYIYENSLPFTNAKLLPPYWRDSFSKSCLRMNPVQARRRLLREKCDPSAQKDIMLQMSVKQQMHKNYFKCGCLEANKRNRNLMSVFK